LRGTAGTGTAGRGDPLDAWAFAAFRAFMSKADVINNVVVFIVNLLF
jgi:hypothetical protein